jgi:WD40 repeat protein
MREDPVLRWSVGCGAELRERLLWRGTPGETWVDCVDCTRLPDGTRVAVCGTGDGELQIWDLATGTLTQSHDVLDGRTQHPRALTCTRLPDGTPVVVTLGQDGVLRVWDLPGARMRAATDDVLGRWDALACTVLPDRTTLAVTGGENGVRFWDVATARPYGTPVPCRANSPLVACPDDTPLVIIADDATLRVWDVARGRFRGEPIATGFAVVDSLRCLRLADGTVLAVAGSGRERDGDGPRYGAVQAWDLSTGRPYGPPMTEHSGEINALACTQLPDGTAIAVSVDRYGSVRCVNLRTGLAHGPSLPFQGDGPAVACARLADGMPVVVVAEESVQLWSMHVVPSPHGFTGPMWTLGGATLPEGDEVLVTCGREDFYGYTVQLWESATGRPRGRLLVGAANRAAGCLRTGEGIAVVTLLPDGGGVRLSDLTSGAARDVELAGHTGPVTIIACHTLRDGTPIVFTGGQSVRAWRADTGQPYGPSLPLRSFEISTLQLPDGTLVVVPHDANVRAWDATTGQPYGPNPTGHPHHLYATDCLTLPDGTSIAVHADRHSGAVWAWDLATGRRHGEPVPLRAANPGALACTRLPDGTVLAAAAGRVGFDEEQLVEIVDPIGGRKLSELALTDPAMDLRFTAEHRLVVRTFLDVAVYDLP